jgi:UDP-N-acetylglucosamine/UDP-N-acetylgalactosamine diphosphorylase
VQPDQPNGVKFEMFVFDALPFARQATIIETDRAGDFSPVKNAAGVDSAATCRDDQLRQFARWLRAAGADVPVDASGLPRFALEISPRFGDDAASVAARLPSNPSWPKDCFSPDFLWPTNFLPSLVTASPPGGRTFFCRLGRSPP